MDYNELKEHGGYITLDAAGRVMRFTTHPLPVRPSKEMERIATELVFSNGNLDDADRNMDDALMAGLEYADRGYSVDCVRGELLELESSFIEPAAFVCVWKLVAFGKVTGRMVELLRADVAEIGGDCSADLPHHDTEQFPAFWRTRPTAELVELVD